MEREAEDCKGILFPTLCIFTREHSLFASSEELLETLAFCFASPGTRSSPHSEAGHCSAPSPLHHPLTPPGSVVPLLSVPGSQAP